MEGKMPEEIKKIVNQLEPLIDGNWPNEPLGRLEELSARVDKIGNIVLFMMACQIYEKKISMDYLCKNYPEGWKIDRQV